MEIDKRYKTARWKRLRKKALDRDGGWCQICLRYGKRKKATIVHHLVHAKDQPELFWRLDNLQSICAGCHNAEHPEKGRKPPHGGYF